MQYDFRKVQRAIAEAGRTLDEMERLTGINKGSLSRMLRTGRAHQRNAMKIVNAVRLDLRDVLPKEPRERRTA